MNAIEKLEAAKDLISNSDSWTKNWFAADENGRTISVHDNRAVKFCALGALIKTGSCYTEDHCGYYLNTAAHKLYGMSTSIVNDTKGHEAIMNCFDEAIKIAKEDLGVVDNCEKADVPEPGLVKK